MVAYNFYKETFMGGSISPNDWPVYEAKASAKLARYKRIYTVSTPDGVSNAEDMAVCAIAEAIYGYDLIANGEGGVVQSASIGSVSANFGNSQMVDTSAAGQEKEFYRCACLYLDIYRGVR